MNLLIKQNAEILKLSYENLEASSVAANNNTKKKFKFKKEATLLHSSKLTNSKNLNKTVKQLKKELQNSDKINIIKTFNNILISN